MSSTNPKTSFFAKYVASGYTTVIGTEDAEFWHGTPGVLNLSEKMTDIPSSEVIILSEILQQVEDPVALLKEVASKAPKILIVVPNEFSWPPQYQPFANKKHKRFYDADLLSEHLDEAGLVYLLDSIEYGGWAFLSAQASKA